MEGWFGVNNTLVTYFVSYKTTIKLFETGNCSNNIIMGIYFYIVH